MFFLRVWTSKAVCYLGTNLCEGDLLVINNVAEKVGKFMFFFQIGRFCFSLILLDFIVNNHKQTLILTIHIINKLTNLTNTIIIKVIDSSLL